MARQRVCMTSIAVILMATFIATNCNLVLKVFTAQGPAEMFALVQSIDKLLQSSKPTEREQFVLPNPSGQGERVFTLKPIYQQPPHLVADNHFSGEEVMNLLLTNRRDRFPDGLSSPTCVMKRCHRDAPRQRQCALRCQLWPSSKCRHLLILLLSW